MHAAGTWPDESNSDSGHSGAGAVLVFPVDGHRELPLFPQEHKEPPLDSSFLSPFLSAHFTPAQFASRPYLTVLLS